MQDHVSQFVQSITNMVRRGLEWIGQYEQSVLVALLVLVASTWLFIALADEVVSGDTGRFDEWSVRVLRNPEDPADPIGPRWLEEVGRDLTALGGMTFLALLTATVAGFLWLRGMYAAMGLVVIASLGGLLLSLGLKELFDRPRPDLVPHLSHVLTSSFPSGHSMMSTTVFLTLGTLLGRFVDELALKAYFLGIAIGLSILVGASRVYLGVHYPTDVLAGWAAGLAWALVCWLVARQLQHRGLATKKIRE